MSHPVVFSQPFEELLRRYPVSDNVLRRALAADIGLLPETNPIRPEAVLFPSGTLQLVDLAKRVSAEAASIEIAADEEIYQEFTRHADIVYLATVVLKYFAAPFFVQLVTEYVKWRVGKKSSEATVKTTVIIIAPDSRRAISIDFEGKTIELAPAINEASQWLSLQMDSNHEQHHEPNEDRIPPERVSPKKQKSKRRRRK